MSHDPDAVSPSPIPFVRFMDHLEELGFEDHEVTVVMAPFSYREVNTLRGGHFDSPEDWQAAVVAAQAREQEWARHLSSEIGFPDTSEMSPKDAHMARIAYLMTKHPQANWDLLLTGQEEAMDRKPKPRPEPVPVTVQYIEKQSRRFLALREQRDEFVTTGDKEDMLAGVVRSYLRVKGFLERHGVDTDALLTDGLNVGSPAPSPVLESVVPDPQTVEVAEDDASTVSVPAPDTMTAKEVALRMNLSYQSVVRFLASGQIPYGKKVGRYWVVSRQPWLDWLASNVDSVRTMSAQAGDRPGRKPKAPEQAFLPTSSEGRAPSF